MAGERETAGESAWERETAGESAWESETAGEREDDLHKKNMITLNLYISDIHRCAA